MNLKFGVHVDVDRATGKTLGVYFAIREGKAASVEEFADGAAFANYGKKGELLGIELLGPARFKSSTRLAKANRPLPCASRSVIFSNAPPREKWF